MLAETRSSTTVVLLAMVCWGWALVGCADWACAQDPGVAGSNGSVAAGVLSSSTKWMASHTNSGLTATGLPSLHYGSSTSGLGSVSATMIAQIQQGNGSVNRVQDRLQQNHGSGVPSLFSTITYRETASASGVIDKFNVAFHYHSTIPEYQQPQPWYFLQ